MRTDRARIVARRLLSQPGTVLAALFVLGLVALALAAGIVAPGGPLVQDLANTLEPPSALHPFGTDEFGRDILVRVIYGARSSIGTAAGAVGIAALVGVPAGLIAGFFGGWRDAVLMRAVDVLLSLPAILLAMALIAVLGRSQAAALTAVGITGIPSFARVTRAQVMALRSRDFVVAVEAFGGSAFHAMVRTLLPNSLSPILVQVVVLSSVAVLLEAALAFLGVGIPPPAPSWGEMLRTGKTYLYEAPTYAVLPGVVLTLVVLSLDTLGRAMADALDERSARPAELQGRVA